MTSSNAGVTASRTGAIELAVRGVVGEPDDREQVHRLALVLVGYERLGRSGQTSQEHAALVGEGAYILAREPEHVATLLGQVEKRAEVNQRTYSV